MSDIAIRVENLGKAYRIGLKEQQQETMLGAMAAWVKSPFENFRSVRNLSRFDDAAADKPQLSAFTPHPSSGPAPQPSAFIPQPSSAPSDIIWALKDVSFEVKHGEVLGIIGRNGAGKSTLLKILSRITEPTRGRASVYGRLGSLLEVGTGFHPDLTGRENIYLNGTILGMKKREVDARFEKIVEFSGVEKFIDTPVKRYSSGMRVRLAFSVAAHLEPEILLVDEVLAVGDAEFQKRCLGKMGDVARQGRTILFVSHNMATVEQLCSRAIVLSAGRITAAGATNSAIHSYLSVDERPKVKGENVLARSPDGSLELLSLGPTGENGESLAMAQCGRDLHLALALRTSKSLPDSTVSVGINSLHEVRIATLHSTIAGARLSIPEGTHKIVCRVPHLAIAPGCYALDAKLYSGTEVALWAPRVQQLVVEQGDFFETGKLPASTWGGVCYLDQEWMVNDFPQNGE